MRVNPYTSLLLFLKGLTMSKIIEFIQTLRAGVKSQKELNDAYMARAVDLRKLQRRLRTLELQAGGSSPSCTLM